MAIISTSSIFFYIPFFTYFIPPKIYQIFQTFQSLPARDSSDIAYFAELGRTCVNDWCDPWIWRSSTMVNRPLALRAERRIHLRGVDIYSRK